MTGKWAIWQTRPGKPPLRFGPLRPHAAAERLAGQLRDRMTDPEVGLSWNYIAAVDPPEDDWIPRAVADEVSHGV